VITLKFLCRVKEQTQVSNRLYTRIDCLLKEILEETDAILGGTDDRARRPSIAFEINRRIAAAGQEVMDRQRTCKQDLEEHP
jgi:hypothetical protein